MSFSSRVVAKCLKEMVALHDKPYRNAGQELS